MRFVPTAELERGMKVARDIVFTTQAAILKKNTYLTDNYLKFLTEKGFLGVYIADEMSEDIEIEDLVDPEIINCGVDAVKNENINTMVDVATDIVGDLLGKSELSANLIDLRSYDDYTYHHSVNVGVLSALVGKQMGLVDSELRDLCLSGICHDLGKRQIEYEILNKPSRLTDDEFEVMKRHPRLAYDFLNLQARINANVKSGVLYHHENIDGSGYPNGLVGDKIPKFARIIHVTDVYDALTSKRPYKNPFEPLDAFFYLEGGKGKLFDEEVVDALISVVPAYPVGIDVFLSNGERAVVVSHTEDMLRPMIRLYSNQQLVDMESDKDFNDVYIIRSGIVPDSEEREVEVLNEGRGTKAGVVQKKKATIMVVDDNKMSRFHLRDALNHDYDILLFDGAMEALNYIKTNEHPDLIISEINMPVMDGFSLMEKIRNITKKDIPFVMQSKDSDKETVINCKRAGATDFFTKPINPIYVKERLYQILNNR